VVNLSSVINVKERKFMKSVISLAVLVAFLTIIIPSGAAAQCCAMGGGKQQGAAVAPETLAKFKAETKGLQEQLIDKQALLQKEWLKDDPDLDAIATIKKAIIDLQRDMQKIAKKLGMKNCQGACPMHRGNEGGWGGRGEMHPQGQKCPMQGEKHGQGSESKGEHK
jgi:hypothetical protein